MKFYTAAALLFSTFLNEATGLPNHHAWNEMKNGIHMGQKKMPVKSMDTSMPIMMTGEEMEDNMMTSASQIEGDMMKPGRM
jgi:hypothetical protein